MGDSYSFTIKPAVANGKISAVLVTDVSTGEVFTYQNGAFDKTPEITPGTGHLKIDVMVHNTGNTGNVTTIISVSNDSLYFRHTERLAPNGNVTVEGVWDMQIQNVTVSIAVNDTT